MVWPIAALHRRDRAERERLPLPAGYQQVEQDRTPAVLSHHAELAISALLAGSRGSWVDARNRRMLLASATIAKSVMRPLHFGHSRASTAKVRRRSSAHGRYVHPRRTGSLGAGASTVATTGLSKMR